jgi:hypothetical protein
MISREHREAFSNELRRRRGRPRRAVPSVVVNVRVPQDVFDALCQLASEQRSALPEVVRQALATRVRAVVPLNSCN